jgi:hypothetical protein
MRPGRRGSTSWIFLAALALTLAAKAEPQQGVLVAVVTDAKTGTPIGSAEVVVSDLRRIALTDSAGKAHIDRISTGTYSVRVRHIGFRPITSEVRIDRDTVTATFSLVSVAQQLDTITVVDSEPYLLPRAFETRRKIGIGRFLTAEQLQTEANREFAIVAMMRFPGLRVVSDGTGRLRLASTRGNCGAAPAKNGMSGGMNSCLSSRPCFVRMWLDDMDLGDWEFDIVRTWDLAGVEYYTGASMPAQYRVSGSACGVLLLWSKR